MKRESAIFLPTGKRNKKNQMEGWLYLVLLNLLVHEGDSDPPPKENVLFTFVRHTHTEEINGKFPGTV